jgi:hypothetical protein
MKECAPLSRSNVPRIMLYDDDGIYSLAQCWPQRAAKAAKLDRRYKNVEQDKSCAFRRNRAQQRLLGIGRDQAPSRHPCSYWDL